MSPSPALTLPNTEALASADPAALAKAINTLLQARVVRLGAAGAPKGVSTGFPALDAATGWDGLPRGHLTELIGRPTSGRTTMAIRAAAAAEGYTAWIDIPGTLAVDHVARQGVDLERLFILRPGSPEEAGAIAVQLVEGGHFTLVVLDSLGDLAPGGPTSRAVSQLARVLLSRLGGTPTAMAMLTLPAQHFQSLAHAASLRIAFTQSGLLRRGGVLRGWRSQARVVKGRGPGGAEVGLELWL
jgi:RecA/RadA recombinase